MIKALVMCLGLIWMVGCSNPVVEDITPIIDVVYDTIVIELDTIYLYDTIVQHDTIYIVEHFGVCKYHAHTPYGEYLFSSKFMTECDCLNPETDMLIPEGAYLTPTDSIIRFWKDTLGVGSENYFWF